MNTYDRIVLYFLAFLVGVACIVVVVYYTEQGQKPIGVTRPDAITTPRDNNGCDDNDRISCCTGSDGRIPSIATPAVASDCAVAEWVWLPDETPSGEPTSRLSIRCIPSHMIVR